MKRGDIYTAATGSGYGGRPRPVLVIQPEMFSTEGKRLVILIGSPVEGAVPVRVPVAPDASNGLRSPSEVMIDAILPVKPSGFGRHVGRLSRDDMRRVDTALLLFLGIGSDA